jgi:hypothetical protein
MELTPSSRVAWKKIRETGDLNHAVFFDELLPEIQSALLSVKALKDENERLREALLAWSEWDDNEDVAFLNSARKKTKRALSPRETGKL